MQTKSTRRARLTLVRMTVSRKADTCEDVGEKGVDGNVNNPKQQRNQNGGFLRTELSNDLAILLLNIYTHKNQG